MPIWEAGPASPPKARSPELTLRHETLGQSASSPVPINHWSRGGRILDGTASRAAEEPQDAPANEAPAAGHAQPTKLERLRAKLRRLKGEDPDIYPMF